MIRLPPRATRTYTLCPYTTLCRSFVAGGLTGVMIALVPFDWQAHDSYFIVAHLHYTLIGGMLFPMFAGLYYFFPFVTARKLSDRLGRIAFWLMFAGFNVTFLPMHLTRSEEHTSELQSLMRISYAVFCLKKKNIT